MKFPLNVLQGNIYIYSVHKTRILSIKSNIFEHLWRAEICRQCIRHTFFRREIPFVFFFKNKNLNQSLKWNSAKIRNFYSAKSEASFSKEYHVTTNGWHYVWKVGGVNEAFRSELLKVSKRSKARWKCLVKGFSILSLNGTSFSPFLEFPSSRFLLWACF